MWRAALTAMLLIGSTLPALAARIDIDDPELLGAVLVSIDVLNGNEYENIITEVRYAAGTYSYVYVVQTTPYFPSGWGYNEGEGELVSVAVTGGPALRGTWGAIYSSSSIWGGRSGPTNVVESMTPLPNGFIAIPEPNNSGSYTVVYWQSPMPPAFDGTLTYTGQSYCFFDTGPECVNEDGSRRWEVDSFDRTVFAPVPEPGSIALLGSGLVGLYATLRRRRAAKL